MQDNKIMVIGRDSAQLLAHYSAVSTHRQASLIQTTLVPEQLCFEIHGGLCPPHLSTSSAILDIDCFATNTDESIWFHYVPAHRKKPEQLGLLTDTLMPEELLRMEWGRGTKHSTFGVAPDLPGTCPGRFLTWHSILPTSPFIDDQLVGSRG